MNARASFNYTDNPYKVRKTVTDTSGNTYTVNGFGKRVDDRPAPVIAKAIEFVTIGQSNMVHKNGNFGPICGSAGTGSGSRGYDLQVKEAAENSIITCRKCLKMIAN